MAVVKACAILCWVLLGLVCMLDGAWAQEQQAGVSQSQPAMPKVKSAGRGIYYPDQAKRLEQQGRILLGFQIDHRGRPTGITLVTVEASKILSDAAVSLLQGTVFERPPASESGVVSSQPYRMSVVFELTPCGSIQHFDVPKDARLSVCGTRLQRR